MAEAEAPQQVDDGPLIYKRLIAIMQDVPAIPKGQTNKQQGYEFRGIDDVMNALHPLFALHGVIPVPQVVVPKYKQTVNRNGTLMTDARLTITYRFYAEDGSYIDAEVQGESRDAADKATNQAFSSAFKYLLFQMFVIPLDGAPEADAHTPIIEAGPTDPSSWREGHPELRAKEAVYQATGNKAEAKRIWNEMLEASKLQTPILTDDEADFLIHQIPSYVHDPAEDAG